MSASSLIFLVILLICAGSIVPSAIRRRRSSEQARLEDRDSAALRVVVRGGPVQVAGTGTTPALAGSSSRPVLGSGPVAPQQGLTAGSRVVREAPARSAVPRELPAAVTVAAAGVASAPSRVVTRRRRLVLGVVVIAVLGWVAALAGAAPWGAGLAATAPVVVVAAALLRHGASAPVRTAPAVRVVVESPRDVEQTVELPVVAAAVPAQRAEATAPAAAAPAAAVPAAGSWAPVAVPLPTYLLKSKAPDRTAAVQRPGVEIVLEETPTEVIDLREQVRVVNG